jgi:hypothetical protein
MIPKMLTDCPAITLRDGQSIFQEVESKFILGICAIQLSLYERSAERIHSTPHGMPDRMGSLSAANLGQNSEVNYVMYEIRSYFPRILQILIQSRVSASTDNSAAISIEKQTATPCKEVIKDTIDFDGRVRAIDEKIAEAEEARVAAVARVARAIEEAEEARVAAVA